MAEPVDNTSLLEILKEIRQELRVQHTLLQQSMEQGLKLERHMDDQLRAIDQRLSRLKPTWNLWLAV